MLTPFSRIAFADSGHYVVTLKVAPEQPGSNGETGFIITVSDDSRQPVASTPVSLVAQQMSGNSGGSMGGMQHGGSKLSVKAKAGAKAGEYVAALKLSADGDWMVDVVHDKGKSEFTVNVSRGSAAVTSGNSTAVPAGSAGAAPMEAVHASYIDLTTNIADLRTRVTQWEQGDEGSLNIAKEKLDRSQAILASIGWPAEMTAAIDKARAAVEPMAKALNAKDSAAAQTAAKTFGDASHDVTHAFYGDWLPALKGVQFGLMAPHAIYLDINNNISDLGTRVASWQKGDESGLNIAKEKVDRIGILLPHMSSTTVLPKPVQAIEKGLPAVAAAIEKKDSAAAQRALEPITEASQDLTRNFYTWMGVTGGATNLTCVQASYLDLAANISVLRTSADQWQKGDESSLKIARERLEHINILLDHTEWPGTMVTSIGKARAAVEVMARGLNGKDTATVQTSTKDLGDASHDITHAYYGDWLPSAQLASVGNQAGSDGSSPVTAGAHGHGASLPNYWFIGSMLGLVATTIAFVPILRQRDIGRRKLGVVKA